MFRYAKCKKDLYPLNSKYKKSFLKGKTYNFSVNATKEEAGYLFEKNELGKQSTMSREHFETYFIPQ